MATHKILSSCLKRKLFFVAAFIKNLPGMLLPASAGYVAYRWDASVDRYFGLQITLLIVTTVYWLLRLHESWCDYRNAK